MQYYPPVCGYPIGGPSFPCNNFPAPAAPAPAWPCGRVVGEGDVTSVALPDRRVQLYFVPTRAPAAPYCPPLITVPAPAAPAPAWPCGRVVGEGDVTSVALPDGSVQLYFVPARAPSALYCPPYNTPHTWNSYPEAWFIRSIPIPFPTCQPSVFNQQAQRVISNPSFQQINSENKPSYHLKFHNDGWTSTTDIHCFYPALRCHNWFPKQSVATQADANPRPCAPEPPPPCFRPCHYTNNGGTKSSKLNKNVTCACNESKSNDGSNMSIEEQNCITQIDNQLGENNKHKKGAKKIGKSKDHECECAPEKHNKASATVTEQATSFEMGRETQATCGPSDPCGPCAAATPVRRVSSFLVNDVEVDFWYPKTPYSKRDMETKESKGSCDCGCADASDSDTPSNN